MASRSVWIAVAAVIIIIVAGSVGYYWWSMQSQPTPTRTVSLYAGEISTTQYGFGSTSTTITSPGPSLDFKVGDVVKVTVTNVGTMPHNWAMVTNKSSTTSVIFDAQIQSADNPIAPGSSASVTFTVDQAGSFFYICQVSGHVSLGMWGNVEVTAQ